MDMNNAKIIDGIRHKIRVKLYPNTLPNVQGKYIARTNNQKGLSIEEICKTLQYRTRYEGSYAEAVKAIKAYFDEAVYQLCDGYSVNTGFFSIHPNVGGTFNSRHDSHDREKNPISLRYRTLSQFNELVDSIDVEIEGLADTAGYIEDFYDVYSKSSNDVVSGGDQFVITGDKLKVLDDGVNTDCGIYFVNTADPSVRRKVERDLAENTASKLIGVTPMLIAPASYRVEIVTQFNGTNTTFLKTPKTLVSEFELTIK